MSAKGSWSLPRIPTNICRYYSLTPNLQGLFSIIPWATTAVAQIWVSENIVKTSRPSQSFASSRRTEIDHTSYNRLVVRLLLGLGDCGLYAWPSRATLSGRRLYSSLRFDRYLLTTMQRRSNRSQHLRRPHCRPIDQWSWIRSHLHRDQSLGSRMRASHSPG